MLFLLYNTCMHLDLVMRKIFKKKLNYNVYTYMNIALVKKNQLNKLN